MNIRNEFQAVVLAAGKGSRMPELTAHKPKCLLPIGGKPMVWYPLYKLQQSGFAEVILIVCDKDKHEIHATLEKTELRIKIEYVPIQNADELGTAESLSYIADRIKLDLIVVSCDLVTNMDFANVLNDYRKNGASLASLFFRINDQELAQVPGPKSKYMPEKDLVGIDAQTNRLVYLTSTSDIENDVSLPINLFHKHPNVKMYSNLLDSHFYVMKHWLLEYLCKHNCSTIKGEFLPHVLKQQFKNQHVEHANTEGNDILNFNKENSLDKKIKEANAYNDHIGDMKSAYYDDRIRCYAIIADSSVIGLRVNTLQAYWSLNKTIASKWNELFNPPIPVVMVDPKSTVKSNQVDACFIWDGVTLNEKTSFRNSIIGNGTEVEKFSRIINSVVMNNVKIHESVVIENCIICDYVEINSKTKLESCIIGSKQVLPAESEHSKEVLIDSEIF